MNKLEQIYDYFPLEENMILHKKKILIPFHLKDAKYHVWLKFAQENL